MMPLNDNLGIHVIFASKVLLLSAVSATMLAACGKSTETRENTSGARAGVEPMLEPLAPAGWADAAGGFVGKDGDETGYVVLTNTPGAGVLMRIDLKGLTPGWHGIHIHNIGDCNDGADGFKASGGHVDPDDHQHGLLNSGGPERADLPNIFAGQDGRATAEIFNNVVALYPSEAASAEAGPFPLLDEDGFAIVVHERPDDHESQAIGGAGARIACAAINGGL